MDLSLATDPYNNAHLGHNHHQYQQQQQQQQQQYNQQQQQHHLQYQYHHGQHPQALSLAPPSGKGLYDLESLEHAGTLGAAPNTVGLGHLGASSSYQPDYGLSAFAPGAAGTPASSSVPGASFHHSIISSQSPGQPWMRNSSNSTHAVHPSAAQHQQYSPIQAAAAPAAAAAQMLHSGGYNAEAHPHGTGTSAAVDHSMHYPSLHGWAGSESHRSQWSQQAWDNCLPPGVEPTASSVSNSVLPPHPHTHTQLQAHSHTHPQPYSQAQLQMYRHLHHHASIGMNAWTAKPVPKAWRKKKPARPAAKKIPVAKTTVMKKESGAVRGLAPENGPGWCFVCQRNCVTEVALKQHLEGKGHKRQAELQKERAELAAKAVDENGGGVASMLEQMWVQVSMMGKPPRVGKTKKKPKTQGQPKDAKPMDPEQKDLEPKAEGEVADAMPTTDVKPEAELKAEPKAEGRPRTTRSRRAKSTDAPKVQEIVRCDICGVECNSKAVLEIHFGGKKHAARVKKLQESAAPSNAEQTTSEQTNAEQTTLSAQ